MNDRPVLHLISQAHLDPVWLWPLHDGITEALTTLQSAVARAGETPQFVFSRSSACTYKWAKEMDPVLFEEIRALVEAGRWEILGGWVEQPDCNLPSTESFIRQALYGKGYLRNEFGDAADTRIGYNVDSFGHAGGLPQILRATGYDRYVFMRPQPHDDATVPLLFWWEAPDGSRVLAQRIPILFSQSYAATADDIETSVRQAAEACFAPGFNQGVMWFGVGNHGGGPTRAHVKRILELQNDPALPELRFSTLEQYFAAVEQEAAFAELPTLKRELNFLFRGCYSSTGWVKQLNRKGEKTLFAAESLQCIQGQPAPGVLKQAWWELLFNQFHDILAGTCVAHADTETRNRYGVTLATADQAVRHAAFSMARKVDTSAEAGSVLFVANPLPWQRDAMVAFDTFKLPHGAEEITHLESRAGKVFPIQWQKADANLGPWGLPWGKLTAILPVPACGYEVFRVVTRPSDKPFQNPFSEQATAEQFVKADAEESTGNAAAIQLQEGPVLVEASFDGHQVLASPLGFVVIEDGSGAWGHHVTAYDKEIGRPVSLGWEVLDDGPLFTTRRETLRWQRSEIILDVRTFTGSEIVEIRVRINWQQKRQLLKLEVPTLLSNCTVHAKMAGEIARREPTGNEEPCHDWVALRGTLGDQPACVALINDSTYAYDACDGRLRLTLTRAVPAAEHPPFEYKDDRHINFLDQGWQERRFQLVAKVGKSCDSLPLQRMAEAFQVPAVHMLDSAHPGTQPWQSSFLQVGPDSIAVLAFKPAENGDGLILRLQELSGMPATACVQIGSPVTRLQLSLQAWQIATWRLRAASSEWTAQPCSGLEDA